MGSAVAPADGSGDYRWLYRHIGNSAQVSGRGFWNSYDMGDRLGKGSFAEVYRCIEIATGKVFAVKVIQRSRWGLSQTEAMFLREIQILTELDHVTPHF